MRIALFFIGLICFDVVYCLTPAPFPVTKAGEKKEDILRWLGEKILVCSYPPVQAGGFTINTDECNITINSDSGKLKTTWMLALVDTNRIVWETRDAGKLVILKLQATTHSPITFNNIDDPGRSFAELSFSGQCFNNREDENLQLRITQAIKQLVKLNQR